MPARSVRGHLRLTAEALERALDGSFAREDEAYIEGVLRTLALICEEGSTEPEAQALPSTTAVETMFHRLDDIVDDADGATAESLAAALDHLEDALTRLETP